MGDTPFFAAEEGVHGFELWKSDGTEAGAELVKDIHPAPDAGSHPGELIDIDGPNTKAKRSIVNWAVAVDLG